MKHKTLCQLSSFHLKLVKTKDFSYRILSCHSWTVFFCFPSYNRSEKRNSTHAKRFIFNSTRRSRGHNYNIKTEEHDLPTMTLLHSCYLGRVSWKQQDSTLSCVRYFNKAVSVIDRYYRSQIFNGFGPFMSKSTLLMTDGAVWQDTGQVGQLRVYEANSSVNYMKITFANVHIHRCREDLFKEVTFHTLDCLSLSSFHALTHLHMLFNIYFLSLNLSFLCQHTCLNHDES